MDAVCAPYYLPRRQRTGSGPVQQIAWTGCSGVPAGGMPAGSAIVYECEQSGVTTICIMDLEDAKPRTIFLP